MSISKGGFIVKLKKYLVGIVTIFAMLFVDTVSATTTAPSNFIINGSDLYLITSSKYLPGATYNFYFKKNANGNIVYCTESHDLAVTSGKQTYTLSKELEAKYAYVLENGYPSKSITGDNEKDYFITALAIYYLADPNDRIFSNFNLDAGTYRGTSNDVIKEVAKLVNGANGYTYVMPSIKINTNDNFTLSSDKKYYVSSSMSVSTTGNVGNYTVKLENAPSDTIITSENGNVKSTFATNEKFIIKVPITNISSLNSELKVSVSAIGTINKAYLYTPSDSKYQNVAVLYPENNAVNNAITLKLNLTTEVQISKVDATTGNELPGAKLTVKDANGAIKDSWTSTNEVHIIKGLNPGKYTLTEEIAPEGYALSTETITFEVKADGSVTKVVMENVREEKKNPIYISKRDITTEEELAGAHLELKNEKGEVVYAWISDTTPHMIEDGLEPGKYYLVETLSPIGYELNTETVEFTVKEDGTVDGNIIMYNKPETIVEVPSTSSFKTITSSLMGIIIIGLGSMVIYRNYKKNEEN